MAKRIVSIIGWLFIGTGGIIVFSIAPSYWLALLGAFLIFIGAYAHGYFDGKDEDT